MRNLVFPPSRLDREIVGGKGEQLLALVQLGYKVPSFFIIPANWSDELLAPSKSADYLGEIQKAVDAVGEKWFAVRSSVSAEDGVESSFAGMFETFLFVPKDSVTDKVLEAYRALENDRVKAYCREKAITKKLKMAVVVQAMLDADCAGVAFSRSPVPPTADVLIDASWGLGEGVVSGLVETDHWRVSRLGEVVERKIDEKKIKIGLHPDGNGTCGIDVPKELGLEPSLSQMQLNEVFRMALQLEEKMGHPVDTEWAFRDAQLYLLQVRPITQTFPNLKFYTDTNLAESYPGVTSPFTASFVKVGYRNVFAESAVLLGASSERLRRLMPHYESLIADVNHHLYYDLEHYYAVLSALPGGEHNIENWHRMIGGKLDNLKVKVDLHPLGVLEQIKAAFKLLKIVLFHDKVLERFCESLEMKKTILKHELQNTKNARESFKLVYNALNRPLGFGLTVINDAILMIGTKALVTILKKYGFSEETLPGLIKTNEVVESLKPLKSLETIVEQIPEDFWGDWDEAIKNVDFWNDPYQQVWRQLESLGWHSEVAQLTGYLQKFGERSFEELKLESPTLRMSPVAFDQLLGFMRHSAAPKLVVFKQDVDPRLSFSFFDKLLWGVSHRITVRAIKWREHTRLLRGQFYNLAREMVYKGAQQLKSDYSIFQPLSWNDFFSVSLTDYHRFAEGQISELQLAELINQQLSWSKSESSFPEFLVTGEGESVASQKVLLETSSALTGMTAAPGKAVGAPLVIDHPTEAQDHQSLQEKILVTRSTDPAWVFIMSRCAGLISEKGSLLSHTAIIGRELGIPTLVGVKGAVQRLREAKKITLEASAGRVDIHEN